MSDRLSGWQICREGYIYTASGGPPRRNVYVAVRVRTARLGNRCGRNGLIRTRRYRLVDERVRPPSRRESRLLYDDDCRQQLDGEDRPRLRGVRDHRTRTSRHGDGRSYPRGGGERRDGRLKDESAVFDGPAPGRTTYPVSRAERRFSAVRRRASPSSPPRGR